MPIPPTIGATLPPTNNGASASNGPQKKDSHTIARKRTRTGRQAEPTTSAANRPQHQQTSEQSHIPPIKIRCIDEGYCRVVSSAGEQTMEAEPATSLVYPAVIEEAIESMEGEASDDATEIPSEVLSVFIPEQQEMLIKHYNHDNPCTPQIVRRIVESAKTLLKTLRIRKIRLSYNRGKPPFPTLFFRLKEFNIINKSELVSEYFAKATVFFSAVNTAHIKNTGCLSSMLLRPSQIINFTTQTDEDIKVIAGHRFLKQIASMSNGEGFPDRKQVADFMAMPCLKSGWRPGNDEAVQNNPVDHELLVHISSMNNSGGFPTEAQVKAFITMPCLKEGWQPGCDEAVQNNPLDRKLLMRIASMHHGRGIPKEAQVKAFITMPCLKEGWLPGLDEAVRDKPIHRKLLRHIASLSSCKGFPAREQVEAFITMPCLKEGWKPGHDEAVKESPIDWKLLIRIVSMNCGKGFPTEAQVKAFMSMSCLKVGWKPGHDEAVKDNPINRELLMRIASMRSRKGFPTKEQLEAFITMPCLRLGWQPGCDEVVKNNPVDWMLLTHIASMNHGKDIPTETQVKAFISMYCLKVGWQPGNDEAVKNNPIDCVLLKHIASMNSGKGFPTEKSVKAFITMLCLKEGWQPGNNEAVKNNPIDRKLLMSIASILNGKGFPTEAEVKAFITMTCLKVGWRRGHDEAVKYNPIDRKLLTRIASILNGKGFPTEADVKAFITMTCLKEGWQPGNDEVVKDNPVDQELFKHIVITYSSRGFPAEAGVSAFVRWLPQENRTHCLKMASRVFEGSGLPEQKMLAVNERAIRRYLPDLPELSADSDDDMSDSEDEQAEVAIVKVLALFCSAPGKWRMTMVEFEQYLSAFTNGRNERIQVFSALASLPPMLFNHGGAGIRFWLARHNENQYDQHFLSKALSIPGSLDNVKFALTQLPGSECLDYITLCINLSPAPNKAQWGKLETVRQKLNQQFRMTGSKTMMLEILWSQPEAKRSEFAEKLDSFLDTVPTCRQLYRIHKAFGPQKMQDFLEACIARQTSDALQVKTQELILEGLLLAHHYLTDHEQIPDLCFSSQVVGTDGKGVVITGDAFIKGRKRLWLFIAAMLIELEQAPEYKFEKRQLIVLSGDGTIVLPKPEFSLVTNGFVINNWSLDQLRAFFKATDFTEQWYKRPQDERATFVIRRDEILASGQARVNDTVNNKVTPLLPSGVILSLVRSGKSLKPAVWSSLEHYANNGQITAQLCRALVPVIESQATIVPNTVKNAVAAKLKEAAAATLTQPSLEINELTFEAAMEALNRFQVLEETELEMLELYRHQMSPIQLITVIKKMSDRVDLMTQLDWHKAYEGKKQDLPGLNEWTFEDDPFDE